jgi:hypothetical protein
LWRVATRAKVAATLLGLTVILAADATPNGTLANLRNWVFDAYERDWSNSRPRRLDMATTKVRFRAAAQMPPPPCAARLSLWNKSAPDDSSSASADRSRW